MVRRCHTWYLRLRVPADLTPFAGQHIVRSLKTSDRTVARAKALGLASAFNGIWMELRQRLAEKLQAYFNREIPVEEMKAFVHERTSEIDAMPDSVRKHFSDWPATHKGNRPAVARYADERPRSSLRPSRTAPLSTTLWGRSSDSRQSGASAISLRFSG